MIENITAKLQLIHTASDEVENHIEMLGQVLCLLESYHPATLKRLEELIGEVSSEIINSVGMLNRLITTALAEAMVVMAEEQSTGEFVQEYDQFSMLTAETAYFNVDEIAEKFSYQEQEILNIDYPNGTSTEMSVDSCLDGFEDEENIDDGGFEYGA